MFRTVVILILAATAAPAQPPADWLIPVPCPPEPPVRECPDADPVLAWNDMARGAVRADRTPPPVAARNLAVVHVAVFDAVNAVLRTHQPFYTAADAASGASPEAAAAAAAHRTLSAIYPRFAASFDDYLADTLAHVPDRAARDAGVAVGRRVADQVLGRRTGDLDPRTSDYVPRPGPGRWQPTPGEYRPPLLPGWSAVPGFALTDPAAVRPPGPPALTSLEYAASYREVKALGAVRSPVRTREQTEIARFWADGEGTVTPPGHWNRIARTVAASRRTTVGENARLFALLNVALADAAIACWECKYRYDYWRPVTAIRATDDPAWEPLLDTPPFPAYTSGHSTFSAAAAAVLADVFGTDAVRFDTTSDGLPGVVRSFGSFSAAAREAGLSRIYGGIHWDFDNRDGLAGGRRVGEHVVRHCCRPVESLDRAVPAAFAIRSRPR